MKIIVRRTDDSRRYNTPTTNDVGAILPRDGTVLMEDYDIITQYHNGCFQKVPSLHANYFPMSYPLLFSFGSDGFRLGIHLFDPQSVMSARRTVTQMNSCAYRLYMRDSAGSQIYLSVQGLFPQWTMDMYVTVGHARLNISRRIKSKSGRI
jgi:hypothetical protein